MEEKWRVADKYRMEMEKVEVIRIWKEYVEDLCNINS